ncbi:fructose 1,6-bisphosphatase [Corynebacterium atypicum]|uniref:Fructose 1,6-bisphosphatase n=1 Tax=Corynebacterium atypicum TaxID=191610 RepID=A0ABM5QNK1_9CORY|nr:inositol monophosphatase [Corynebacterium atypicum]AIG64393.1 fructose 1,6-bisphosphatase [Corynebacterium atypicum]
MGERDWAGLLRVAEEAVSKAERVFIQRLGAPPSVTKGPADFATQADLDIEALLRAELGRRTGIPVLGEEGGGGLGEQPTWVVDPIDGTANYSVNNPMAAILISLLDHGQPVVAVTSIPVVARRLATYAGGPITLNGKYFTPDPNPDDVPAQVGFSSVASPSGSDYSSRFRQTLLAELAKTFLRPRITGSVGVDLAFTAMGVFGGALSLSPHLWDNAAGVLLARAAGRVVTDAAGRPWTPRSVGVVAGAPASHEAIMTTIARARAMTSGD